jgi:predicted Ser/Thr protein kinase
MEQPRRSAAVETVHPAPRPPCRADLQRLPREVLNEGRWANAVLLRVEHGGATWVVKDFRPRNFLVRNLLGRLLIRREARNLVRLAGLPGVPREATRIDAHALAYRYVPGRNIRGLRSATLGQDFFVELERRVRAMHESARVAHLDLRNARNILVSPRGEPLLIDFQSAIGTGWFPGPLRRLLLAIDLAAIYKHWSRRCPETLGADRAAILGRIDRVLPLWMVRGYFGLQPRNRPGNAAAARPRSSGCGSGSRDPADPDRTPPTAGPTP